MSVYLLILYYFSVLEAFAEASDNSAKNVNDIGNQIKDIPEIFREYIGTFLVIFHLSIGVL